MQDASSEPEVEGTEETVETFGGEDKGENTAKGAATGMKWKSFKHAVTKEKDGQEEEEDWWSNDRWKERIQVVMTEKGPNIIIPEHEKQRLAKRWQRALIVKLLGRMVNPEYLELKLRQLWPRQGEVDQIDVGAGFFVITFTNDKDYELALTGGPWLIYDHYLAIQPWKPDFDPEEESITKIAAWIRIAKLPLDYYDNGILHVLGSQVGKVLKTDMNTTNRKKGRFARICVELDLSAPLRPLILINGKAKRVQYEGIHLICFHCGCYGHDADHCPSKMKVDVDKERVGKKGEEPRSTDRQSTVVASEETVDADTSSISEPRYESWMVVQRPRRGKRSEGLNGKGGEARRIPRDTTVMKEQGS